MDGVEDVRGDGSGDDITGDVGTVGVCAGGRGATMSSRADVALERVGTKLDV